MRFVMFRKRWRIPFEIMLACVVLSAVWSVVFVLIVNANR